MMNYNDKARIPNNVKFSYQIIFRNRLPKHIKRNLTVNLISLLWTDIINTFYPVIRAYIYFNFCKV